MLALLVGAVPAQGTTLTSIEDALRLNDDEAAAGQRVRLQGVVSYADPVTRDFFLAESSGAGISMWYPDPKVHLTQGDLIELEGHTARGRFAPTIAIPLTRLRVLAHGAPVPVTQPTQAQLTADGLDCRHIETDGVVRDVTVHGDQVELRLSTLLGPTRLLFATGVPAQSLKDFVGAEIRARATVGVDLNAAHQRVGLRLYAQSLQSVRVLHPSLPDSALGHRALADLLRFTRTQQSDPRVRVQGDVIYAAGRQLLIEEAGAVARLTLAQSEAGRPLPTLGARVEAAGFVEPGEPLPRMEDARILSVTRGGDTPPIEVTGEGLLRPGLEDRLVRVRGTLSSLQLEPWQVLSLQTSKGPALAVSLESGVLQPERLQRQAVVEVVGIKSQAGGQSSPVVLIRRAEDVRVLQAPPFWSLGRVLVLAAAALLVASVMVLKWLWAAARARQLQRLVEERTAALTLANHSLEERTGALEKKQQEVVELHHFRARFIATLAHDLRSPLNVILLNAGMLTREEDREQRRQMSHEASEAAEQINRDLTRLVQAYRDEEALLRTEPFEVSQLVEGVLDGVRPWFARKGQVVEFLRPTEEVWVQGDAEIFAHVVSNLLSNASKFSPAKTRVTVRVDAGAPQVRVSDQGPGLEAKDLERLFDAGRRPDVRPTASELSSGQGLLLCHRWMQIMGGAIGCRSVVGQGSTFELSLPKCSPANSLRTVLKADLGAA